MLFIFNILKYYLLPPYNIDFFAAAGLENPMVGTLLSSFVNLVATGNNVDRQAVKQQHFFGFLSNLAYLSPRSYLSAFMTMLETSAVAVLPLIESAGRRPLLLTGIGGMAVSALVLTGAMVRLGAQAPALEVNNPEEGAGGGGGGMGVLALAAVSGVLAFVSFFELGLGAIPWSIGGEIFPPDAKDAALGFAAGGGDVLEAP